MNRGEIAVIEIRKRIIAGEMKPGHRLKEKELCQLFGLSRTPVREALVRLQQEGFVEEAEGKKFKVSEITLKSILELHEIRELMEGHAVKRVAKNRTRAQVDELRELTKRMEQALGVRDPDLFFEADLEFHAKLIRFCGNRALQDLAVQLTEKIQRVRFLTLYVHRRLEETIDEHSKILDGIEAQDPRSAQKALNTHLQNVKKGVEKLFAERGLGFLSSPL